MKNQRKIGAVLSYVSIIASSLVQLLYTPIMVSKLGQSEYGLYSLAASIIGYLSVLDLGFGNAIIVYTSKYRAQGKDKAEAKLLGMFRLVFQVLGVIAGIASLVMFFCVDIMFGATMTSTEVGKMKIMMLILGINVVMSFFLNIYWSIIRAYEKFLFLKAVSIIHTILQPLLMLPLLFLGAESITMATVISLVNIGCNLAYYIFCRKKIGIKIKYHGFDKKLFKTIFGYSFFIFLAVVVDKINWSVDRFILGAVSGTIAVSIYSIAGTFNQMFINLSNAISDVLLPKISKMVATKATDKELSDELVKVGRIQYLVIFLAMSGYVLFGREFIHAWVGQEYDESYFVVLFLAIPLCLTLIQNLGISIMQAKNKHQFRAISTAIMSVINVIISIFLARAYGAIGAAMGTAFSLIVINIFAFNVYYKKAIHLDIGRFWLNILRMTIPFALPILAILGFMHFVELHGYLSVLVYGGIYVVLYSITAYFLSMNRYEKDVIHSVFRKLKPHRRA